jgi:hypothetical protein
MVARSRQPGSSDCEVGVARAGRMAGTVHCAAMASLLSGIVLVAALAVAAAAGIALVVGLFRVSARRPAGGERSGPRAAAEPGTRVS